MANTVIDAGQVLIGDKVRVTFQVADVTISREGVVAEVTPNGGLYTQQVYSLCPTSTGSTVIELLDRPKPKIVLPTGEHAVIQYRRGIFIWTGRFNGKNWQLKNDQTDYKQSFSVEELTDMLNDGKQFVPRTDYKVLFEGVAK